MRIAVLSNSHAAALALAARTRTGGATFTFFASDGGRLHDLSPDGPRLVPGNDALRAAFEASAGTPSLDTAVHDAFVVYALGFMVRPLGPQYSAAVREAALSDRYAGFLNAKLVGLLRSVTHKPILAAPTPLRAHRTQDGDAAPASLIPYADMLAWTERCAVPAGVRVVGQPAATRSGGFFTAERFNVDAPKLTAPGEPQKHWGIRDVNHMNAEFGALMLQEFEAVLSLH